LTIQHPPSDLEPGFQPAYATQSAVGTPALVPPVSDETVEVTIDGHQLTVPKGQLMITAAEEAGIYIPRFCYHPRMKPVGMCRMCLVEVKGPRGASLMPACYNTVADGMEISTHSEMATKAQDGVLEFLLVNHPLDCPVCDKGGECPLQDQTMAYGPGETRFVEEKRHWDKPIPLSDLVYLDRERCIQCGRCVRFADEVAGDALIDFAERGDKTEVATFPDAPYASYFSGNVVQICPVGALTATPYRFKARPWDLDQVESTCTSCSVGCRVAVQSSSDELTRYLGVDSDPVNWGWLCDKGRFDFEAVESDDRLTVPLIRQGDELVEASWGEALTLAAEGLAAARDAAGGTSVAVVGGARLPNEDAYAWSKLARVALRTDNVDAQLGDGLPAATLLGLPRATIDATAAAPLVITLAADIKEELPVLYLRLKDAAERGSAVVELTPARTGFSRYTAQSLRYTPGQLVDLVRALAAGTAVDGEVAGVTAAQVEAVRTRMADAWEQGSPGAASIVVVLGRPSLAEPGAQVAEAAAVLAGLPGVKFLSALRRSNVHGALDLGLAPGVLPGRVGLEEGRAWYEQQWDTTLPAAGLDTAGILASAADGGIGALVLVGADPLTDFPDAEAAARGVAGARFVVAIDTFLTDSARQADVVLPAATYAERRGTFTNLEGRITWLSQKVTAPGVAWPDWMIAGELAAQLGFDFGWDDPGDIWAEIEAVSPLHRGVDYALLNSRAARDGVLVPHDPSQPTVRPRRLDPMADPGIATAELNMASFLGSGPPVAAAREAGDQMALASSAHEAASGPATGSEPQHPTSAPADVDAAPDTTASDADTVVDAPSATADPAAEAAKAAIRASGTIDERPAMLRPLPAPPATPAAAAGGGDRLALVAVRTLWDAGTMAAHSPHLSPLPAPSTVRVNPADARRLGLTAGVRVNVRSPRGRVVLPVALEPGVPEGSVVVPFNQPGVSAATLIDASAAVTMVDLQAVDPGAVSVGVADGGAGPRDSSAPGVTGPDDTAVTDGGEGGSAHG
jgi:NADH-quinone oxidoreductase subunit G